MQETEHHFHLLYGKELNQSYCSVDGFQVAFLAIHTLGTVGRVTCYYRLAAFRAAALPELAWVHQRHAFFAPLVGAFSRNGNVHLPVEFQFLRSYFIRLVAYRTAKNLFGDIIWNFRYGPGNSVGRTGTRFFRSFFIMPVPAFYAHLFFGQRIIVLRRCFVVSKRRESRRVVLTPFPSPLHMLDDFRNKRFVAFT